MVRRGKLLFTLLIVVITAPTPENRQPVAVNGFWQTRISLPSNCPHHNSGIHHEEREATEYAFGQAKYQKSKMQIN